MRKQLLIFLIYFPLIGFAQQTYIPDDNFEQELINLGVDSVLDDSVFTNNIKTIQVLEIDSLEIRDLTGIEGFSSLVELDCSKNKIKKLYLTQNTNLLYLNCSNNKIKYLAVNNNPNLSRLNCSVNKIRMLNVSENRTKDSKYLLKSHKIFLY